MTESLNTELLNVEVRGTTGIITLNRPKALNSLNGEMIHGIYTALRAWEAHDMKQLARIGVGVVVVDGAIAAETDAPRPQVPWAFTALWMACPLLALAAIPRIARRSSPTRS